MHDDKDSFSTYYTYQVEDICDILSACTFLARLHTILDVLKVDVKVDVNHISVPDNRCENWNIIYQ